MKFIISACLLLSAQWALAENVEIEAAHRLMAQDYPLSPLYDKVILPDQTSVFRDILGRFNDAFSGTITFDDLKGWRSGRCYYYNNQQRAVAGAMIAQMIHIEQGGEDGPIKPPTSQDVPYAMVLVNQQAAASYFDTLEPYKEQIMTDAFNRDVATVSQCKVEEHEVNYSSLYYGNRTRFRFGENGWLYAVMETTKITGEFPVIGTPLLACYFYNRLK